MMLRLGRDGVGIGGCAGGGGRGTAGEVGLGKSDKAENLRKV